MQTCYYMLEESLKLSNDNLDEAVNLALSQLQLNSYSNDYSSNNNIQRSEKLIDNNDNEEKLTEEERLNLLSRYDSVNASDCTHVKTVPSVSQVFLYILFH